MATGSLGGEGCGLRRRGRLPLQVMGNCPGRARLERGAGWGRRVNGKFKARGPHILEDKGRGGNKLVIWIQVRGRGLRLGGDTGVLIQGSYFAGDSRTLIGQTSIGRGHRQEDDNWKLSLGNEHLTRRGAV